MKQPTLMQQNRVKVADIVTRDRLRPVSQAGVDSLIASVKETGVMKDAIHIRKKKDGALYLIAGAHRLEMARRLGWDEIEAKVWTDVTDDWALMMEIDDNLAGAEMNALDTAVFLATRKAVYERLHPEKRRGVAGGLARQGLASDIVSFAESSAEKFSISKRQIARIVAAGVRLGPSEVAQLRAAPRPVTQKDLEDISRIGDPDERSAIVLRMTTGKGKSAADARRSLRVETEGEAPVKDPIDVEFLALLSAFDRARKTARRRFVEDRLAELQALIADVAGGGDGTE
ncbi:MAG: ParB/RepB/Spo0J family partition protein [Gemmobacter sp.]|nr:ParB/RepB/Spo0J family partition protein [Gemmobacter sp.]